MKTPSTPPVAEVAELAEKRPSEGYARELAKQAARKQALAQALQHDLAGLDRIVFEPGCGHGHWLADFAQAHPATTCVGVDLISWRIRKGNEKKAKRGLDNLFFYKAELSEFLAVLPPRLRFERTVFLFPDPWPKARHHRRRMVQTSLLDEVARRTDPGGAFCFRSDDRPYYEWTREHLAAHPDWSIDASAEWPYESETYFQGLMPQFFSLIAKRVPT